MKISRLCLVGSLSTILVACSGANDEAAQTGNNPTRLAPEKELASLKDADCEKWDVLSGTFACASNNILSGPIASASYQSKSDDVGPKASAPATTAGFGQQQLPDNATVAKLSEPNAPTAALVKGTAQAPTEATTSTIGDRSRPPKRTVAPIAAVTSGSVDQQRTPKNENRVAPDRRLVVLASYLNRAYAAETAAKYETIGATIEDADVRGKHYFRVVTGPHSIADATALLRSLKNDGMTGAWSFTVAPRALRRAEPAKDDDIEVIVKSG